MRNGDPTRLLSLVAAHQGGEACICGLTPAGRAKPGLRQATVSYHWSSSSRRPARPRTTLQVGLLRVVDDTLNTLGDVLQPRSQLPEMSIPELVSSPAQVCRPAGELVEGEQGQQDAAKFEDGELAVVHHLRPSHRR